MPGPRPYDHRGRWSAVGGRTASGELGGAAGPESTAEGWGLCSWRRGRWSGGRGSVQRAGPARVRVWTGHSCCHTHTCPLSAAQCHPGARGDLQLRVRGAPCPLHQQSRRLQPQQVVGPGAGAQGGSRAVAGTRGLTPVFPTPQCRLPALPLPEAAAACGAQGLPGAAAAAQPPADPLSGAHAGRVPAQAPAPAPNRCGPRRGAYPAAPPPGVGRGRGWEGLGGWLGWDLQPLILLHLCPLTGAAPPGTGHRGLHHPRARPGPLRLPAARLPAGPPHLRCGGPHQRGSCVAG